MAKLKTSKRGSGDVEIKNAAKTLLANIRFLDVDNPVKTIVMTSSIPNEGKSYVSQLLCEAIATSGKTVLLVECDLRRRTLASRLGVHVRHGLYGVLSGDVPAQSAIVATHTPNMYFLAAEPNIPNPSDLFASHRFAQLLEGLSKAYDYVLLDTPPVTALVDAAVLSRLVDATFLVIRENFTRREQVRNTYDQLSKTGGKISGVIMNYCKYQSGDYYYSYYYGEQDGGSAPKIQESPSSTGVSEPDRKPRGTARHPPISRKTPSIPLERSSSGDSDWTPESTDGSYSGGRSANAVGFSPATSIKSEKSPSRRRSI